MGKVICQISISLDGFVAGPNQSLDNPLHDRETSRTVIDYSENS